MVSFHAVDAEPMITHTTAKKTGFALTITVLALLAGCSSGPTVMSDGKEAPGSPVSGAGFGQRAAQIAIDQVGDYLAEKLGL